MTIFEILTYFSIFIGLYFAIFIFSTFFENRKKIHLKDDKQYDFPLVSLVVPCYNEELNIAKTIQSILNLDYPSDKLDIIVIDDGSNDQTYQKAKEFELEDNRVRVFKKENGGKYTALNLGISKAKANFVATVDADSYLHTLSLRKMMLYFADSSIKATISTVVVDRPKNILEGVQYVEYLMGGFLRKVFSFVGGINVVPGPLAVFRKEVFEKLGAFRRAYQTEDLEIALRMQRANYKIAHAIDAIVYTNGCKTFKELFYQRLRWRQGLIFNFIDYKDLLNLKKHGNLAFLMINSIVGIFLSVAIFLFVAYQTISLIIRQIHFLFLIRWDTLTFSLPKLSWITLNTTPVALLSLVAIICCLIYILLSKIYTLNQEMKYTNIAFYILLFPILNAVWWISTFWSTLIRKEVIWK